MAVGLGGGGAGNSSRFPITLTGKGFRVYIGFRISCFKQETQCTKCKRVLLRKLDLEIVVLGFRV